MLLPWSKQNHSSEDVTCLSWAERVVTSFTVSHAAHCITEKVPLSQSSLSDHSQLPDCTVPDLDVPEVRASIKALTAQDTRNAVESLRIIRKQHFLFSVFHNMLSLMCLNCLNDQCSEINCPDQCTSLTVLVINNGNNMSAVLKTCALPGLCSPETVNLGELVATTNAMCCNTALCNNETLPVPVPNGRICYTCFNNNCTQTVNCGGNEDRCITGTGSRLDITATMKGCVGKSFCSNFQSFFSEGDITANVQCCDGNLCNSAEIFTLSFLFMIISLHSSMFFS
ncbi:urokinase plasminogen activator surface receptor-like isoform X1 [Tachysurus ichikawai]